MKKHLGGNNALNIPHTISSQPFQARSKERLVMRASIQNNDIIKQGVGIPMQAKRNSKIATSNM